MVLQQKQDIPIWGKAEPGGEVIITLNEQQKKAIVDENGKWKVTISPVPTGGPYELVISGEETHTISNVMVGEVWICSGQSNMQMPVNNGWGKVNNPEKEVAEANYPNIRLLHVERITSTLPVDAIKSKGWEECSPATISEFSATAYFFGRHLHKNIDIPIGLIHTSWGGTVAEAWTSGEVLKTLPDFKEAVHTIETDTTILEDALKEYKMKLKIREKQITEDGDGFSNGKYIWNNPQMNLSDWQEMILPTLWENAGHKNLDGAVWFRKNINIPESMSGKDLWLHLGPINDDDITWFNGVKVGTTKGVFEKRKYKIPGTLVKAGINNISIRVFDLGNSGGLYGKPSQLKLVSDNGTTIPLAGAWKYKIGLNVNPVPQSPEDPNRPTVLYNAMIHPLLQFPIRGAIWYQGESNAGRAAQYRTLFPTMIKDWRSKWNQGDFPFLFVQLANYMEHESEPQESDWAELREAQTMALELPNTGMAVTIDIGDAQDIHPRNKQDVGKRLALNALAKVYRQDIPYSGPMYKAMKIEGNKIRIQFTNANKGLKINESNQLTGFAIAGADKKLVWADAKIEGDDVVVWNTKITNPIAVRYAWANNPICNLYNGVQLPASPFRTDSW
ncbi:MAG: 9-O-acetylesterase [Draconibacterium sp.]|nr:9-O-acetylesterase [Draconibacterium sp.]